MARSREGHVDLHLRETALSNCRYFTVFHNTADAELLAHMMLPLTGQVPIGLRANADAERLPVAAEQDAQRRHFSQLRKREMVLYDSLEGRPRHCNTPDVPLCEADQAGIDRLESAHLQVTGRPAAEIRAEASQRQAQLRALLGQAALTDRDRWPIRRRALPPASFGGGP